MFEGLVTRNAINSISNPTVSSNGIMRCLNHWLCCTCISSSPRNTADHGCRIFNGEAKCTHIWVASAASVNHRRNRSVGRATMSISFVASRRCGGGVDSRVEEGIFDVVQDTPGHPKNFRWQRGYGAFSVSASIGSPSQITLRTRNAIIRTYRIRMSFAAYVRSTAWQSTSVTHGID